MTRDPFLDLLGDELRSRAMVTSSRRRFRPEAVMQGRRIRRRRVLSVTLTIIAVVGIAGTAAAVYGPGSRPVTPPVSRSPSRFNRRTACP